MNTVLKLLNDEQMTFLHENSELIEALRELADSEKFEALFGDMTLGAVLDSQELTMADENVGWEGDLRQRYEEIIRRETETGHVICDDEDFSKLEAKYRK